MTSTRKALFPATWLGHPSFQQGVALLSGEAFSVGDCISYYIGKSVVLSCMAVEALAHRSEDPAEFEDALIDDFNGASYWANDFVLRTLSARCTTPVLGRMLAKLDGRWGGRLSSQFLQEFLTRQVDKGETPTFGDHLKTRPDDAGDLTETLKQLRGEAAEALRREYESHTVGVVDVSEISKFGRILGPTDASQETEAVLEHRFLLEAVDDLERRLVQGAGSVLLVGEPGVGKTSTLSVLARRLCADGWTVFEAGTTELMSDQSYIGSLEGRLKTMFRGIGNRPRVLWLIPAFHEFMWAGVHRENPVSLLDHLFPHFESGAIRVIAETHPEAFEEMSLKQPRLRTALQPYRLKALDEASTQEVVSEWSTKQALPDGSPGIEARARAEVVQLSWQYLGAGAAPGRTLRFLEATRRSLAADAGPAQSITTDKLLASLSGITGIPSSVLDHRAALDLSAPEGLLRAACPGAARGGELPCGPAWRW